MFYEIQIGEAILSQPTTDWGSRQWTEFRATTTLLRSPKAPKSFSGTEDASRETGVKGRWDEFFQMVGLEELFLCPVSGLLHKPQCVRIEQAHLERVRIARQRWARTHHNPGFRMGQDHDLARLLWLEFWFDYALQNCERPALWNEQHQ